MGDHDDRVAAVVDEPWIERASPCAARWRLHRLVEQHRQVAEPVDQEAVDHRAHREFADDGIGMRRRTS
jgi:hypothetical protein